MKRQLFLIISAILLSSWLSGSYFYQKGKSETVEQLLVTLSGDYAQLRNVKSELEGIFSKHKGDQIKDALYLLRNIETANTSLLNISTLLDETDFGVIQNEVSLTTADLHTYIHQSSLDFDTTMTIKKLRKHGDALLLITETLSPKDIRTMDQDRIRYRLSLLQNSLPH